VLASARRGLLLSAFALGASLACPCFAADDLLAPQGIDAIILPPQVEGTNDGLEPQITTLRELLTETAQDLNLVVELSEGDEPLTEHALTRAARERGKVLVMTQVHALDDDRIRLRIVAARPGSRVLSLRTSVVAVDDLEIRAVVMLRDVITSLSATAPVVEQAPIANIAVPVTSRGRSILAVNGTLYGGFVGYSMQRASESDDPRLLYPLMAVGAGVGLGATLIVADEWDVGVGDAWFLAGAWWPAVAGHLIYEGRFGDTPTANADEAWSFGLVGSAIGLTVATTALLPRGMGDGGAVLAHSGGALGLIVGGLGEFAVSGDTETLPFGGTGYGAAAGWLLASGAATLWHPDPGRVLLIDLGLLLGGLVGASAASPLLFDEPNTDKTRGWVAATGGGLVAGGVVAAWLSSPDEPEPAQQTSSTALWDVPQIGMLPLRAAPGELHAPAYGVSWTGQLR